MVSREAKKRDINAITNTDHFRRSDSTSQACNFRDSYADFGKLGYKIYGVGRLRNLSFAWLDMLMSDFSHAS